MLQIIINSIIAGFVLALVAIGFNYIFRVTKVFHIAHGGIYVAGGYSFLYLFNVTGNWFVSLLFALVLVVVLIVILEQFVYLPLNKSKSNQTISLISSIGIYAIIVNLIAMIFGNESKILITSISGSIQWGDIIITNIQLLQLISATGIIILFMLYLKITKSGLTLQSVADNETISKTYGINTDKERKRVFITGSVLVCTAAILRTLDIGIDPQTGIGITLTAAVVAILISKLDVTLIVVISIILTALQNAIEWFFNAQWRDGLTFLLLLVVILIRTEGIISYNIRKDTA